MKNILPITHSIIDSQALANLISENWNLPEPIHCELLTRGMNDVYMIKDGKNNKWACRVWRSGFRSKNEIKFETDLLHYLFCNHYQVPNPIFTKDKLLFIPILAPEGVRFFSIFSWVNGENFGKDPSTKHASALGVKIAELHKLLKKFKPETDRTIDMSAKLAKESINLLRMVTFEKDHLSWYDEAINILINKINTTDYKNIDSGIIHGDFHLYNAFIDNNNNITIMDYDNCGFYYFIYDLCSFIWSNDYLGVDKKINQFFLEGYNSIKSIGRKEQSLMNLFYTIKEMSFLTGFATNVNYVGHTPFLNPDLEWFLKKTKTNFEKSGII